MNVKAAMPTYTIIENRLLADKELVSLNDGSNVIYVGNIYRFSLSIGTNVQTFDERLDWCFKFAKTYLNKEIDKIILKHTK